MKAWAVFGDDAQDGVLLVYANTRNEARRLGFQAGLYDFDEYMRTNARRSPAHDGSMTHGVVVETNEDLPGGVPAFYDEEGE